MDKEFEAKYHIVEQKHWWFVTRRELVRSLVKKQGKQDPSILDIGCASGLMLQGLESDGLSKSKLTGIDISPEAIEASRELGYGDTHVMDGGNPDALDKTFDIIVSSDCLEHIKDDETALKKWHSLLNEGGRAIVFVPAYQFLWTAHDDWNHHFRRYTKAELVTKAKAAGFEVKQAGYWNTILFPLIAALRFFQQMTQAEGDAITLPSAPVNAFFRTVMRIENGIFKLIRFPFGVSTYCILEKPSSKKI